jgi:NTE family protein
VTDLRADLVLEGGGVRGIGHVGAVSALAEAGYTFPRVAGTSAGAIVGSLVAAGMRPAGMRRTMETLDYLRFRDRGRFARIPLAGPALALALRDGIYQGDYLREWLGNELSELGVETFADLRREDVDSSLPPEHRYGLVVMAADLTRGELVRLPWHYRSRYGLDPDEQLVVDAVRASMSIPFYFQPVTLHHADGTESMLVDGGVLSNYPIDTFDRTDGERPRWPTFGVKLIPRLPEGRADIFPLLGLVRRGPFRKLELLVTTMIVGHDQEQLAKPWVQARTMQVDTQGVSAIDFGLSDEDQEMLHRNGRAAAEEFLQRWDWDEYLRRFRSGEREVV